MYANYEGVYNEVRFIDADGKDTVKREYFIKSIITQVGKGTSDPAQGQPETGDSPHKARITIQFAEFQHRRGLKTSKVKEQVEKALEGRFPAGVRVIVDKNQEGPPQKPPINIEVKGPGSYEDAIRYADAVKKYVTNHNMALCRKLNRILKTDRYNVDYKEWDGISELRLDVETDKLELAVELDKKQLRKLGTSTSQVASLIRTALFGKDVSIYKWKEDSYDINLRLSGADRNNLEALLDQEVVFRNMRGQMVNIPIRSLVKSTRPTIYSTYGSVVRKDAQDVVSIYSKVKKEDEGNTIVAQMEEVLKEFEETEIGKEMKDAGYSYEFTGGQKEQEEQMGFLSTALGIAVFLILLIIVTQFNSFRTPAIIMFAVLFSFIGVLLGLVTFRQDFVIMMTMIGIISLAGVVVNNAIVLIDYTNLIRKRKREERGLTETEMLPMEDVIASIIEGGQTRLRPVLLTAITTVLGLIPLATGLNINFVTLFTQYDPQIFIGGDNAIFFGPMSWTIIYGLTFATFLTLVIVPVTYLLLYKFKIWIFKITGSQMKSSI